MHWHNGETLDYRNLDSAFGHLVSYIEILSVHYFGIEYLGYKKSLTQYDVK